MKSSRIGSWEFRGLTGVVVWAGLLCLFPFYPPPATAKPSPVAPHELPDTLRASVPADIEELRAIEQKVADVVKRVAPAVVAVRVGSSAGTAVIISEDGYALSAAHVGGAPDREVTFTFPDGRKATGRTLGRNLDMDSGLMKITDPGPWPHVDVCDPENARVGDWVLALGHPGGFVAERPVVVRLGRIIRLRGIVQTDCTLISGDSGGPLFDMEGHVIGIHSRISESTSDNYHVPVGTYLATWDRLANSETWGGRPPPSRSTIGVRAMDTPDGCRIESLVEEGPAAKAGMQPGDIVLRVNDQEISDTAALVRSIREINPGNDANLLVRREGVELSFNLTVELRRRNRGGGPPRS
jgi:serine protease Do